MLPAPRPKTRCWPGRRATRSQRASAGRGSAGAVSCSWPRAEGRGKAPWGGERTGRPVLRCLHARRQRADRDLWGSQTATAACAAGRAARSFWWDAAGKSCDAAPAPAVPVLPSPGVAVLPCGAKGVSRAKVRKPSRATEGCGLLQCRLPKQPACSGEVFRHWFGGDVHRGNVWNVNEVQQLQC